MKKISHIKARSIFGSGLYEELKKRELLSKVEGLTMESQAPTIPQDMLSIKFYLTESKSSHKRVAVRLIYRRMKAEKYTNMTALEPEWDHTAGNFLPDEKYAEGRTYLAGIERLIERTFNQLKEEIIVGKIGIGALTARGIISRCFSGSPLLTTFYQIYIETEKNNNEKDRSTLEYLTKFLNGEKYIRANKNPTLENLINLTHPMDFLEDFEEYLHGQKLTVDTVRRHINRFRASILHAAITKEIPRNPYANYKYTRERPPQKQPQIPQYLIDAANELITRF